MGDTTFRGAFHWIPVLENGPTVPFTQRKISAFAYVAPRPDVEGAVLVPELPHGNDDGMVEARWLSGYPEPTTRPGDVVTLVASQRPIATITVTDVS